MNKKISYHGVTPETGGLLQTPRCGFHIKKIPGVNEITRIYGY